MFRSPTNPRPLRASAVEPRLTCAKSSSSPSAGGVASERREEGPANEVTPRPPPLAPPPGGVEALTSYKQRFKCFFVVIRS